MNTKMLKPAKIMMVNPDGTQIELEGTISCEKLNTYSINEEDSYKNTSATSLSYTFGISASEKLNRKKLIKLLMAKGIQRNGANEIAKYLLKKNGRYTIFDLLIW